MYAILLDKPIPPEGRKPTTRECKRFRDLRTNIRPTTSGAWMLVWDKGNPCIVVHNHRYKTRCGWNFQIVEPPNNQQPTTRTPEPAIPPSNLDVVHGEPTMCW